MSKRFGRNQRRKARQELAAAKAALERYRIDTEGTKHVLEHVMLEKLNLERVVQDITEMLPAGSALLPPKKVIFADLNREAYSSIAVPCIGGMFVERIPVAVASIKNDVNFGVHFYVNFGQNRFAYAISKQALEMMPLHRFKDVIAKNLGRQFADLIAEKLSS